MFWHLPPILLLKTVGLWGVALRGGQLIRIDLVDERRTTPKHILTIYSNITSRVITVVKLLQRTTKSEYLKVRMNCLGLHYLLYGKSKTLWNVCKCLFVFVHMSDCVFVHKTCSRFTAVLLTLVSCHPIMQIEVSSVPIPASTTSNTANWPDL